MTHAPTLRQRLSAGVPDLVVDLDLYATGEGGKVLPVMIGYGCPCSIDEGGQEAWDGYPLLESPMSPGEKRRVGFVFLSSCEAVRALSVGEYFYLWEGRLIGKAKIVR